MGKRTPTRLNSLLLALLMVTAPALADSQRERAKKHFDRAVEHMREKELEPALAELESAYQLDPHFAVLLRMGQVHAALGHPDRAVELYERYLQQGGDAVPAEQKQDVARAIAAQKQQLASVTLQVSPAGARVAVDGKEAGRAPLARPLLLLPGVHELAVSHVGYESKERSIEATRGTSPVVYMSLRSKERPSSPLAKVDIECAIPDVVVRIDGEARLHTPLRTLAVPAGKHTLSFERPGYHARHFEILADPQASPMVRCGLRPLAPIPPADASRLEVELPPGARLFVDGSPSRREVALPRGKHVLVVQADGFLKWSDEIALEPRRRSRVQPELMPDGSTMRARQSRRTLAYSLAGGGAALVGVAGAIYFWNDIRYDDWRSHQRDLDEEWSKDPPRSSTLVKRQADNDKNFESIQAFDRVVIGAGVAGTALIAGGVVLYLTGEDPSGNARPVVAVGARSSWAGWNWRW